MEWKNFTNKKEENNEKSKQSVEKSLIGLGGQITSNYLEVNTQISKYHTKGGHGFAAEDANTLIDSFLGKEARVIGKNNALNGADRLVDGTLIQTKYYRTPRETINSAFDPTTGLYRYKNQILEVPADQYDACVKIMEQKIREGKVPGVKDPKEAKKLVKKGHLTYKQAVNIAKAGKIESIVYDATNQAVVCSYVLGISFVTTFALAKWQGKDLKEACKMALAQSIKVAGENFVAGIITSQLLRTQLAAKGTIFARHGVKALSKTSLGKKAIEQIAKASLGKSVYGAAAVNHVSKLLRTNVITGAISTIVVTGPDFYKTLIEKSMTWEQLFKNLLVNTASIGGGIAGAEIGAAVGTAIAPGLGTAIGFIIGGLAGGMLSSHSTKRIADVFIKDDIEKMKEILGKVFKDLGYEYLLTEEEMKQFIKKFKTYLKEEGDWIKNMIKQFRENGRIGAYNYAYNQCSKICKEIVNQRTFIKVPDIGEVMSNIE